MSNGLHPPAFAIMVVALALLQIYNSFTPGYTQERKEDDTQVTKYQVLQLDTMKYKVKFVDAPANLHSLDPQPERLEPMLKQGDWLIVSISAMRGADLKCLNQIITLAHKTEGKVNIGVRMFWYREEMRSWFPLYLDVSEGRSPVWIVTKDGQLRNWKVGHYSQDDLFRLITP